MNSFTGALKTHNLFFQKRYFFSNQTKLANENTESIS